MALGVAGPVQPHVYMYICTQYLGCVLSRITRKKKKKQREKKLKWSEKWNCLFIIINSHVFVHNRDTYNVPLCVCWRHLHSFVFVNFTQYIRIETRQIIFRFLFTSFIRFVHFVSIKNCRRYGIEWSGTTRNENEEWTCYQVVVTHSSPVFFRSTCPRIRWYKNSFYDIILIFLGLLLALLQCTTAVMLMASYVQLCHWIVWQHWREWRRILCERKKYLLFRSRKANIIYKLKIPKIPN